MSLKYVCHQSRAPRNLDLCRRTSYICRTFSFRRDVVFSHYNCIRAYDHISYISFRFRNELYDVELHGIVQVVPPSREFNLNVFISHTNSITTIRQTQNYMHVIYLQTSLHIAHMDLLALASKPEARVITFGTKSWSSMPFTYQSNVYFCFPKMCRQVR